VIFTLRRIINPKLALVGGVTLNTIDGTNLRALDSRTISIPCHAPFSTLPEALTDYNCYIVPVDYDPRRPVGTGAFMWESFTPGVQSVYVRNPNYWQVGLPYVDKLVIYDYPETTSQVNALASGEVDYIDQLPAGALAQARAGGATIVVSTGGAFNPFVMRVDQPPFTDVRVRQAFRYMVDRPQMRTLVYAGYGDLGNDLFALTDPQYDHEIPQRVQDLDLARFLLKSAGHESLTVQLVTAPIAGGVVEAATVFAQQASRAGVKVNLQQINNTAFFGPAYTTRTFTQDDWMYTPYFAQVAWSTVPGAPVNETHFDNARYNSLYAEALRTIDTARKTEIVHEMQMIEYDVGGYIIPMFSPFLDAHSPRLHGIVGSRMGMPSWAYCFKTCWFET
jgi:peptide/nickel transport system substrate-binding protein